MTAWQSDMDARAEHLYEFQRGMQEVVEAEGRRATAGPHGLDQFAGTALLEPDVPLRRALGQQAGDQRDNHRAGIALEFYDFTLYGFFAAIIGRQFFPIGTPLGSLLLSVAVFGVGFVTWPLGGVGIGAYGRRLKDRGVLVMDVAPALLGRAAAAARNL